MYAQSVDRDRGQAVMLLLAVVALLAVALIAVAQFGRRVVERGDTQTAADAAALAATTGGRLAADRVAAAAGATVVRYAEAGDEVTVVVEFHQVRAIATATDGP